MIKLEENDFIPLERFKLKWRWTDPRWNKLPDDLIAQIRPLCKAKADEISKLVELPRTLSEWDTNVFGEFAEIDASRNKQEVSRSLRQRFADMDQQVLVSWDNETAVMTSLKIFCDYWDDFCYPSSDDVSILPLTEEWLLLFFHYEIFHFGRKHA